MDFATAAKHAKQLKSLLRSFETAEEVLHAANGAINVKKKAEADLVGILAKLEVARAALEGTQQETRIAKDASTKRLAEIKAGLNTKVTEINDKANAEIAETSDRVTEALRGEEQAAKDTRERIRVLIQREAGVTATCDEAEKRLKRLKNELAKL